MESELAKTLRSMSDDHRMVPDFSEKLLDIADAIERLAKELVKRKEHIRDLQGRLWSVKETRNHLRTSLSEIQDTHQKTFDDLAAARAEVERLKAEIGELAGKWAGDMAADLLSGVSTVKD